MSRFGINVPKGIVASTLDEVEAAAKELPGTEVVVKSQVLAGGRGLGTFKNGFKGGVHIVKKEEARSIAGEDWFNAPTSGLSDNGNGYCLSERVYRCRVFNKSSYRPAPSHACCCFALGNILVLA